MIPVVTKGLVHDYVTRDEEGNASETKRALDHVEITVDLGNGGGQARVNCRVLCQGPLSL